MVLPDEPPGSQSVPGAADGLRLLRGTVPEDPVLADAVADAMRQAVSSRKGKGYEHLYGIVAGTDTLSYLDQLLDLIPGLRASPERIYDLGRRLVTESEHR